MRRFTKLTVTLILVLVLSGGVLANGLSLNSIGTRALGMGGAFVGLADNATAIYWNPAGITNVKGGFVGFDLTDVMPMGTYKMDAAGVDAKMQSNHYFCPNLFATYQVGDMTFGLGVYVPAGLGAEWVGDELKNLTGGTAYEWMSKIGVVDIAPSFAYRITPEFSLGLAVNIYYGMFDLKRPVEPMAGMFDQYSEESTGTGVGVTLGALWDVSEMVRLGASFRSETKVSMSGTATLPAFTNFAAPGESEFDRDVAWPMWIAGGIALMPCDAWTITFDVQYSQWSKSSDVLDTEYKDETWKQMMAQSEGDKFVLKWKDATQIRLGVEYDVNEAWAVRGGYYYDPAPAPDETVNILFPSSTNHVLTGGFGWTSETWMVQGGLEYLFGAERDIEMNAENDMPGKHQMDIFAWSVGVGYAF